MANFSITLESHPSTEDRQTLSRGLIAYNVAQSGETEHGELATFIRDDYGKVMGGVSAEWGWNWTYVDLVWLDESLRGQGYGQRMMNAIEQGALTKGISNVYLSTTSFQALPFYRKIGYEVWGTLNNRPQHHHYYYLRKQNIAPTEIDSAFVIEENPSDEDCRALIDGLRQHTIDSGVLIDAKSLAVFVRDNEGKVIGGLYGRTYWNWFDLMTFWLDERLRGQGVGSQAMDLAKAECVARGMTGIVCDTTSFQALPFYQKQAFKVFGTLENRPKGHTSYFLKFEF